MKGISMNHKILETIRYATVSTVDENGQPWAAPVWYVYDDKNIYWWSPVDSQHSLNIANNPSIYITIFDSTLPEGKGLGLYMRANAQVVSGTGKIEQICDLYNQSTDVFKLSLENTSENAPTRLYIAEVTKTWVNSDSEVNAEYVDTREEIEL